MLGFIAYTFFRALCFLLVEFWWISAAAAGCHDRIAEQHISVVVRARELVAVARRYGCRAEDLAVILEQLA